MSDILAKARRGRASALSKRDPSGTLILRPMPLWKVRMKDSEPVRYRRPGVKPAVALQK